MSLILEALKKLEREKGTPEEHGFVVVASQAWPEPRRNRAVVFFLVGLGLAAALGLFLLARPKTPAPIAAAPPNAIVAPTTTAPSPVAPFEAPTPRPAPPRSAPFVPPTAPSVAGSAAPHRVAPTPAPATPPSLVLQAISERDGKPIALVSDRLVREGDEFDGVRVVRIGDAEVEIEWRGQRSVLRF